MSHNSLKNLLGPAPLKKEYDVQLNGGLDWMMERVLFEAVYTLNSDFCVPLSMFVLLLFVFLYSICVMGMCMKCKKKKR